ncbi:ABC-F family ATP-binding cassette domain-containing protein [Spiroplasma endosymbiont of Amphibalanus improvisus]|uniref:ABC-F family ATP-binding cassette domain-containing protein n=1 Tax=Spiroplasma endosymbiont of Amphibalanus improvisus TaxID=3066327 RepID=UPI00313D3112
MSILRAENITHKIKGKPLYEDATLIINNGEHIALVGPNGAGKTTLLNILSKKINPDNIFFKFGKNCKIGYLDQHQDVDRNLTVIQYLHSTYQNLYDKSQKIEDIYSKMSEEYNEKEYMKAMGLQEELEHSGFYSIDQTIGNLIDGLAIDKEWHDKKLEELSGGQRGKVLLAKLLLSDNDLLLLDEPTNFLDVQQVKWLIKFLNNYKNAFLLVSHDRDFINQTCSIIYAIENKIINRYVGNFEKFIEQSELRRDQYEKAYESQIKKIDKLKTYVDKNKARASTAKSAQSRQKQIDKMVKLDKLAKEPLPKFNFKYIRPSTSLFVKADNLEIGYKNKALLKPLTFEIRENEKWIVKGYNGIGKTTLLNTLYGLVDKISGTLKLGDQLKIGYFKQIEDLDERTPIEYLKTLKPNLEDKAIKTILASVGIKTSLMFNKMNQLSGGQQTKVRIAELCLEPYGLLILDEPTNHIDIAAKSALLEAIQKFKGAILITTHDINFETNWADKILNFEDLI